MKRPALQNKQVGVWRMALRARKVFGTFEKRVPAGVILTKAFFNLNQPSCWAFSSAPQLRFPA